MSGDIIVFHFRCGKSLFELKIKTSLIMSELIETLKKELQFKDEDDLVILCPTSEGKMMEIKSDDDIEFIKKNKLCLNTVSKEVYCSLELVVIMIPKEQLDDMNDQIKLVAKKIELLGSQFEVLLQSLTDIMEESKTAIIENIWSIVSDHSKNDSCISSNKKSIGEQSSSNVCQSETNAACLCKNKIIEDKEKLISTTKLNENSTNSEENVNQPNIVETNKNNIDDLLEMLANEGFTNTIQNIIVLKRFDNDFDKAISYLKSSAT